MPYLEFTERLQWKLERTDVDSNSNDYRSDQGFYWARDRQLC